VKRPKNIKFGTKVAPSTRIMNALIFLESFLAAGKLAKKPPKRGQKMNNFFFMRYLRNLT